MKQLGNVLYITRQGAYVSRDGTNIVISQDREELLRLPIHTIMGLVCFGNVLLTPFALGLCGENGVTVSFLTENGHFLARSTGRQSGNVLLRRAQHRFGTDPELTATAARSFVAAKIANARTILLRFQRDHTPGEPTKIPQAIIALAASLTELKRHPGLEQIRGIEGEAAKTYFGVFDELVLSQKGDFFFRDRSGRPSLALDFMEEFRSWIVDRFVLKLINLGQVKGKDMVRRESGAVEIKEDVRKELIKEWQDRKKETILHPFLGEKAPIGLLPFLQAQLFARWLRGDLDAYPPLFYR